MLTLKITDADLNGRACPRGRTRFNLLFPNGLELTDDQVTNFETLATSDISEVHAWPLRDLSDLHWLAVVVVAAGERAPGLDWHHGACGGSGLFYVAGLLADAVGCRFADRR